MVVVQGSFLDATAKVTAAPLEAPLEGKNRPRGKLMRWRDADEPCPVPAQLGGHDSALVRGNADAARAMGGDGLLEVLIVRFFDCDRVPLIDQGAQAERNGLLRAADDQDIGLAARDAPPPRQILDQCPAQRRESLGIRVKGPGDTGRGEQPPAPGAHQGGIVRRIAVVQIVGQPLAVSSKPARAQLAQACGVA